jgi:uncharacterized protein YjbI with pentapeptide repeats
VLPGNVAKKLRAFSPDDVLAAYRRGTRDFSRSNLLRLEIEAMVQKERYLDCLDRPDIQRYNALWVDFRNPVERDFDWDMYGRCVSLHPDAPDARDLKGAALARINLSGSYLYPVDFSGADLSGADFRNTVLIDCTLIGTNLWKADLRDAKFIDCDLSGADLYMARMERVLLSGCNATRTNLRRAKLYRARLSGVNLRRASLDNAHCDHIVLADVDFRRVDLSVVTFEGSRVSRVVISPRQVKSLLHALGVQVVN